MVHAPRAAWNRRKVWSRAIAARALLLSALGALGAYAHAFEIAPGYSIKEIPYAGAPFYWMDNESVLFNATHRTSANDSVYGSTWESPALYKWNTRTGQISELMRTGRYTHLCYDRGYIYVAFDRDGNRIVRRGPLGSEVETVIKKGTKKSPFPGQFNRYSCRWEELPKATQPDRGVIAVLRNDHGFIEAERPWDPFPERKYFLVRPNEEPKPIDFHGGAGAPPFSVVRNAYVFQYSPSVISANTEGQITLVHLDGHVTGARIPPGQWMRGYVRALPTRDEVFMTSLARQAGAEGGYLISKGKAERILKAMIGAFSVSPDGCALALVGSASANSASHIALLRLCGANR